MELVASSTIFTPCTFSVVYVYLEEKYLRASIFVH